MRARIPAILLASMLLAAPALAADTGTPYSVATGVTGLDGLFFTTGGKTLKAATTVFGGGFLYGDFDGGSTYAAPFTATAGLTDRLELALAGPLVSQVDWDGGGSDSGVGDISVRMKYSLQGETEALPAYAVLGHVKVGVAETPLGTEKTDFGIGFAADKDFAGVQTMISLEYTLLGGDFDDQLNWALGMRIPYSDSLSFSIELLDQYLLGNHYLGGDLLVGGMAINLGPAMTLRLALGLGLNEVSPDVMVGTLFNITL